MPTPITAAVTYIADQIPSPGSDMRTMVDTRVAEIIAEKVKKLVAVDHELSPGLPRNPCHYRPVREYLASAELFVLTKAEYEQIKRGE